MLIKSKAITRSLVPIYKIYQPPTKTKTIQLDLFKQYQAGLIRRPLTFDEKCLIINDPKMISHIELVEYGITFKPTNRFLVMALLVGGLIMTYLYKHTPHPISQRFFSISQQSKQHKFGHIGALLSFQSLFKVAMYAPAFIAVLIGTRYLKPVDFCSLIALGTIGNYIIGNRVIEQKLKTFEVWDRFKIVSGEGLILSIIASFLSLKATSILDLFNNLRLRLFFQSRPGLGITSAGIPIIIPLIIYFTYELYSCYRQDKSPQLLVYYILTGVIYGLMKRSIFRSL